MENPEQKPPGADGASLAMHGADSALLAIHGADGALLAIHREIVKPEWIDYNGHMNVAYYVLAFDHATDAFLDTLDLGLAYRQATDCSFFVAESHVTYAQEVGEGQPLRFTTQVLAADGKRIHLFHCMYRDGDDTLVAANELMLLHVDLNIRRTAPLPDKQRQKVVAISLAHGMLPRPPQAGSVMAIKPKPQPQPES